MKKNILIADDSKILLMYISLLLKRLGVQLLTAKNGLEALRLLRLHPVDLVILDVHMDTLDGISTLRHIKSDNKISHLPVIMISLDGSFETVKTCKDLGCIEYLAKPIKIDRLHDAIERSFSCQGSHCRKHIRTEYGSKVVIDFQGKRHHLYAETISGGGVYVRTENPLPVGSDVVVELFLDNGNQRYYSGRVIYTKNEFGDFFTKPLGMAIQFKELSPHDYLELNSFIKNLVAGDIFSEQGEKKILEP